MRAERLTLRHSATKSTMDVRMIGRSAHVVFRQPDPAQACSALTL